jgi:hypothetical protein
MMAASLEILAVWTLAGCKPSRLLEKDLGASKKFLKAHTHGLGNPHCRINRNIFLSTFHSTDKHGRQIGFFSQGFLGEFGLFSMGANRFSENSPVLRNRMQSSPSKQ